MAAEQDKKVTIEKAKDRVILTVDGVKMSLSPKLAREMGDGLYRAGWDVENTART